MKRFANWPWAGMCAVLLLAGMGQGAETERLYLSGKGKDDPVKWDFQCSAGQHAGAWSTIGVPSNWELQGFGIYTYGTQRYPQGWPKVQGKYRRTFTVPAKWAGKTVNLVFEGVMTDTQAFVNGQSAGPMHQGGYYQFKFDVTKLVKAGENLLEVTVDDESANASVNAAERRGDYWNYGGIFRPVYLEALPEAHIERVAIDARADGTLNVDVVTNKFQTDREAIIRAQVFDANNQKVGEPFNDAGGKLTTKIANPKTWNAETPTLYQLELTLDAGAGRTHTVRQKFGFRTIEARPGEGVFVNGQRIMFKGADRHSFWPDSGRCLSEQISRDDIALMKDMNMNAVRCSHYPPDQHFLDACDEMGMYVLDELAGWHAKYDSETGHRLVEEMVTRDVNHPCILFWDNGNEGGWNNDLNDDFARWDIQKRAVLHPWELFRGIDTKHYPDYNTLVQKAAGSNPFFPTEMLHGLYDGGAGAGLEDYWKVLMASEVSAGGFIWALVDESVKRTDQGGKLDSHGNQAPDGIVGPYREKEGSFYAIKELWSPIVVTRDGNEGLSFTVENHYAFTDARDCTFTCEYRHFTTPGRSGGGYEVVQTGGAQVGSIPPGASGKLVSLMMPGSFAVSLDAFAITARDPGGRDLWTWVWPLSGAQAEQRMVSAASAGKVNIQEDEAIFNASVGDLTFQFNRKTGLLASASRAGKIYSFANGPRLVAAAPTSPQPGRGAARGSSDALPDSPLTSFTQRFEGNDLILTATYSGPMKSISYRLRPNGWLTIDYAYTVTGPQDYFGVAFDYPEKNVQGLRYLGNGPYTVYKNRLAGGTLNVWEKKYNDTIVGDPDTLAPGARFDYPQFKGYYAGVKWLQLQTTEGPITALINQDDLFVQVLTPKTPPPGELGQTGVAFPRAGLSFLHAIPPIGSKFSRATGTGPQGQPTMATGEYRGSVSLYFGPLP